MMIKRLRGRRAQALVETALIVPMLVMLMRGSADMGRAFYLKLEMSGASRAGMRMAVLGQAVDIGNAVRAEPNSAIPNNTTAWGLTGPGAANGDCTSPTQNCGDPNGCPSSAFANGQLACFAVRTCTTWASGTCAAYSAWNVRPSAGVDQAVEVLVVYKFTPATPFIANFAGPSGSYYLPGDTLGLQLY
jgi:Flp pilus assembly protein TadG